MCILDNMRINIIIPDKVLEVIDTYCENEGYKRSTFLVMSALKIIGKENAGGLAGLKATEPVSMGEDTPSGENHRLGANPITSQEEPQFSSKKKEGYHFSGVVNGYVKD